MHRILENLRGIVDEANCSIADGPIFPHVTPREIRDHLARYDFSQPAALDRVCADVEHMLRDWHVQVTHPRYFGLFNPSVTFASVVADTLVAMYNPQLATWRTSPAANEIERHTLEFLASKFGFPRDASASFTTGGAEANLTAVVVALTKMFPEYAGGGVRALKGTPVIYITSEANHSFHKIAHMTGLGRQSLREVATDACLRMDVADLARRVAEDRENGFVPFIVSGTAGTTAAGVIDPLPELARFCRSENLWFHADAAWGGAAILSPRLKPYLAGIEAADSITCDAHKWFSVSMGAGMFFCRHPEAVTATFHAETPYMPAETPESLPDQYTRSVQWSRRFIGLKLFLSLAERGESGYIEMIERQAHLAEVLRELLQRDGWRIVNATPLPVVWFTREGSAGHEFDASALVAALRERQIAWMSAVPHGATQAVRACITSFHTTEADIEWVVQEMKRLL